MEDDDDSDLKGITFPRFDTGRIGFLGVHSFCDPMYYSYTAGVQCGQRQY